MPPTFRTRGKSDEPWEQGLYVLLLLVAVVVILYSLFGIATLLGDFPLSQKSVGGQPAVHPAPAGRKSIDHTNDGPLSANVGGTSCVRRAGMKVVSAAGSSANLGAPLPGCVEGEPEGRAPHSAVAPIVSKDYASIAPRMVERLDR